VPISRIDFNGLQLPESLGAVFAMFASSGLEGHQCETTMLMARALYALMNRLMFWALVVIERGSTAAIVDSVLWRRESFAK
jgi:hypothetical protein